MKTKIVIASTLKPVDDVRAYWKFAQSMVKTNKGKYDVNIIGNEGKKASLYEDISFHPHRLVRSQLLKRLFIGFRFFVKVWMLKPDILIVNTHELLFPSVLTRMLRKCYLIYDIQENYSYNITLEKGLLRRVFSYWILIKERILAIQIDHFILAEVCYANQLSFLGNSYTVIENKAISRQIPNRSDHINLLFSGTISRYAGAVSAMSIANNLSKKNPEIEVLFIGQIHDHKLHETLKKWANENDNVHLKVSFSPIPYEEILSAIDWATLGIISYQPNFVNQDKVPTKLYEYSRYKLPYLIHKNTFWETKAKKLGGAIPVDIANPDIGFILNKHTKADNLFTIPYPEENTWEYESMKLIRLINTCYK